MKIAYLNKSAVRIDKEKEALKESLRWAYLKDRRKAYAEFKSRLDKLGISEEQVMSDLAQLAEQRIEQMVK